MIERTTKDSTPPTLGAMARATSFEDAMLMMLEKHSNHALDKYSRISEHRWCSLFTVHVALITCASLSTTFSSTKVRWAQLMLPKRMIDQTMEQK